jgi:diguanylate cyclase (GGDEF)-like protein
VLFDIDHFKTVNDTYGHGVGDEVLRRVAGAAAGSMGDHAVIGRIGGEEFAVLFSAADECSGAAAAEHIRTEIAGLRFDEYPGVHVTASFGVALLQPGFSAAAALRTADEALYRAKRGGRNRVELAGLSSPARPLRDSQANGGVPPVVAYGTSPGSGGTRDHTTRHCHVEDGEGAGSPPLCQ